MEFMAFIKIALHLLKASLNQLLLLKIPIKWFSGRLTSRNIRAGTVEEPKISIGWYFWAVETYEVSIKYELKFLQ